MGITGAGKSSLIRQCCENSDTIKIGHNLEACTSIVEVHPCRYSSTTSVYLIDTPGFDDTNRNDTEVLREIATWLTDSYSNSVKLTGIIYLHRISDVRMQGSAKRNLAMFKKLCGQDALRNVILATTMWDKVSEEDGAKREGQLIETPEFWGWMKDRGSTVLRHAGDRDSAMRLIQFFIDKTRVTLDLQDQMVDKGRSLDQTAAGKELQQEFIKQKKKFDEEMRKVQLDLEQAMKSRDRESIEAIQQVREESKAKLVPLEKDTEDLKVSLERLHEKKYADL